MREEIKIGDPDWSRYSGPALPVDERFVILSLRKILLEDKRKSTSFDILKENVSKKLGDEEIEESLQCLKERGLIDYIKTLGKRGFVGIKLTSDGKIVVENGGRLVQSTPSITTINQSNVSFGQQGNQTIMNKLNVTDSFNVVYEKVAELQDKDKKVEAEKIVREIEEELKKEGNLSKVKEKLSELGKKGYEELKDLTAKIIANVITNST